MGGIVQQLQYLNQMFQKSMQNNMPLQELCDQLCDMMKVNIYLFREDGRIFCSAAYPEFLCEFGMGHTHNTIIPNPYLKMFNEQEISTFNYYQHAPYCTRHKEVECAFSDRYYSLVPIYTGDQKKAGLLFIRYGAPFTEEQQCLCEYACMAVSLELLYQAQIPIQQDAIQRACSQMAIQCLTHSELHAVAEVLDNIDSNEGSLVLRVLAERLYVAKSLLTGALKKLESAGVLYTHSMGTKGTKVTISNDYLRQDILLALEQGSREGKDKMRETVGNSRLF